MQQTIKCEICGEPFSYDYIRGSLRTVCNKPSCRTARRRRYGVAHRQLGDKAPTETTCMLVAMYYLEGYTNANYIAAELNRPVEQINMIFDFMKKRDMLRGFFKMFANGMFAHRYAKAKESMLCEPMLTS